MKKQLMSSDSNFHILAKQIRPFMFRRTSISPRPVQTCPTDSQMRRANIASAVVMFGNVRASGLGAVYDVVVVVLRNPAHTKSEMVCPSEYASCRNCCAPSSLLTRLEVTQSNLFKAGCEYNELTSGRLTDGRIDGLSAVE